MKSFAELFKRYRLRAEFETFSSFGDALAEKGYYYEDSIFSHWQKGNRTPTNRRLVLTILQIFKERDAIKSLEEANEFLASVDLGYLTSQEEQELELKNMPSSKTTKHKTTFTPTVYVLLVTVVVGIFAAISYFLQHPNYITPLPTVSSAVTEPKKLVIGIDATLEPMEYIDNGKMVGYDIDLSYALAKELHADIEFQKINFDDLFNTLDQHQINMIISAVTITRERQQKYAFSEGYLNAGQVIIARKEDTTIHTVKELRGKKIATQTGTTNEQEALKYTSDNMVLRYPSFVEATQALKEKKVDALFTDLPNAKGIVSRNADLKINGAPFTQEYYGIVFLKNDPSVTQVNYALMSLRKHGILAQLERKWLR